MNKPYIWMDDVGNTIGPEDYETLDDNLKDGLFPLFTEGSITKAFYDGRQQGMQQEHAFWKLANSPQELTDDEIRHIQAQCHLKDVGYDNFIMRFARAILKKAKE